MLASEQEVVWSFYGSIAKVARVQHNNTIAFYWRQQPSTMQLFKKHKANTSSKQNAEQKSGLFGTGSFRKRDDFVRNKAGYSGVGTAPSVKECQCHPTELLALPPGTGDFVRRFCSFGPAQHPLIRIPPDSQPSCRGCRSLKRRRKNRKKGGKKKEKEKRKRLHRAFYQMTCRSVLFALAITKL